jgi:predicted Zn-dependent peptidase
MEHLDAASVEDVQEFFRIYYAPNNAVIVLSGAFDADEAKKLIETYFGDIPSQPLPSELDVSEPTEVAATYKEWEDKHAPFPAFLIGWKIPPRRSPEFRALYLAGKILYDGDSSRLYQKLVKGEEAVIQLFGFTDERRGPSSIFVGAIPKPEKDLSKIRETIMNEIHDLAAHGPTAEESSMSRAQQIAEFALYDDDPTLVNSELEELLSVTAEQIRHAVGVYLNTDNRALLDVVPASKGAAA